MLVIVLFGVVARGVQALSLNFVITNPVGLASGGIANALIGTILIVAVAALMAVPIGCSDRAVSERICRLALTPGPRAQAGA